MAARINGGWRRNIHRHCTRVHLLIDLELFGEVFLYTQSPVPLSATFLYFDLFQIYICQSLWVVSPLLCFFLLAS